MEGKATLATIEDLYHEPGKAELMGGRIVRFMSTGEMPGWIGGKIYRHLAQYAEEKMLGCVYPDNVGFAVRELRSTRQSFSPDVSFLAGPRRKSMKFIDGAPTFAIEIRSETEYANPNADAERAAKRADYFEAGTQLVWDVDPLGACIQAYRSSDPQTAITFQRGQKADAEPVVPGWRVDVDWVFA